MPLLFLSGPSIAEAISGNTAGTPSTIGGGLYVLAGGSNITLSQDGSTVSIIGGAGGGGGSLNISAGTTSNNLTAVTFSNSNGVSFGLNASTLTASVATSLTNIKVSAGTTSGNRSDLTFSDSNGISFGLNTNGIITATVKTDYLTSQSNQNVTAANGGFAFQTLSFSNANNFSFGTSAGSAITGSYTVPTVTNSSWTVSDAATSGTVARLAFTNLNGITLSLSSGAGGSHTIVGSHNALTSQSTDFNAITLGGNTAGTTTFHATNNNTIFLHGGANITLSGNGSSITISGGAGGGGITNINLSAGTTSNNLSAFTLSNSNNVSFGLNGSTVTATASFNQTNQSAIKAFGATNTGNTAGNTGVSTGIDWVIAGTDNITVSESTVAGGPNTLWLSAPAGGGGATLSGSWIHPPGGNSATVQVASVNHVWFPWLVQQNLSISRINHFIWLSLSTSSNSSHRGTISFEIGIYTRTGSTLSRASSGSQSYAWTNTSNNSTANLSNLKMVSIPVNANLTPGEYWIAFKSTTSSGNANWFTASNLAVSYFGLNFVGSFLSASNASNQVYPGWGLNSQGLAASVAFSNITGANNATQLRIPVLNVVNYTV
jgi:hypothetical protein